MKSSSSWQTSAGPKAELAQALQSTLEHEHKKTTMLGRIPSIALIAVIFCLNGAAAEGDVDWHAKGAVTPVKNQGASACNYSWAFASIGAVESAIAISTGSLVSLSEQQLIDCGGICAAASAASQCSCPQLGCAFSLMNSTGLCLEGDYPYTGTPGTCASASCTAVSHTNEPNWTRLGPGSEAALVNALDQGPIIARLEIGSHGDPLPAYLSYSGGIFLPAHSDSTVVQWVLVVGYAPTYFIVKNSLGTGWGESGYMRLARGGNFLGVENFAYAVTLEGGAGAVPAAPCATFENVPMLSLEGTAGLVLILSLLSLIALSSSRSSSRP